MYSVKECGGASILVVEDDPGVRAAVALTLSYWKCRVLAVASTEQADAHLLMTGLAPDLILTDLHLSRASGYGTALDHVPQLMKGQGLSAPVIVMTGDSDPDSRSNVEAMGWTFLLKPFSSQALRAAIVAAMARSLD